MVRYYLIKVYWHGEDQKVKKRKSKQRRKELIYVTVSYTQFKYRVKTVKSLGLTKKPLDTAILLSSLSDKWSL